MAEVDLFAIIKNGFTYWKNNLKICIPFIIQFLIILIISLPLIFGFLLPSVLPQSTAHTPFLYLNNINISAEQTSEIVASISNMLPFFILTIILLIIVMLFVGTFFYAGAIGMAKEIIVQGETSLSHMWNYGKRKIFNLLGAHIIIGVLMMLGFFLLFPGILSLSSVNMSTMNSMQKMAAVIPLILGLLAMAIYIAIVSILFVLVPYAVVIGDTTAIEGIKRGYNVFMHHNKINVFAMWIITVILSVPLSLTQQIPVTGPLVYLIIMTVVFSPLVTLWWTDLYLEIAK